MKAINPESDERLLVEAAQRDPRRFAELYELHFRRVYAYVIRRVERREEAEDVTSEVFHHALAKIKSFEWRGAPFSAWLMRIAANAITDRWRGSRENDLVPEDLEDTEAGDIEQCALVIATRAGAAGRTRSAWCYCGLWSRRVSRRLRPT